MLGKDITYKDLDDNPITEKFWFHLSKAEIAEMALAKEGRAGGFDAYVRRLIESQDGEVLIQTFKEILLMTIGQRSEDNKYFEKSDEYTRRFVQSDAYSVLLMELLTDTDKMTEFINGVVPSDMREELSKQIENAQSNQTAKGPQARIEEKRTSSTMPTPVSEKPKDDRPEWIKDPKRVPTEAELRGATPEQLMEAFRRKSSGAGPVTQEEITGS